ncbi:MAG: type II toxin-antitoxin system VapC family toxin [Candidatus Korobacteraceae bacterium]
MSLVYWDTMLFIYWLEAHPQYGRRVNQIYRRMSERGDQLCTSVFTLGEILTGAYKTGRTKEAQSIRSFFESDGIRILLFNTEAADRYAKIRAQHNVLPADAIHLAAASVAQVDLYLTNDARLKKLLIEGIQFIAGLDSSIL